MFLQVQVTASKNLLIPLTFITQKCFPQNSDDSLWLGYLLVEICSRSPIVVVVRKLLKTASRKSEICIFSKLLIYVWFLIQTDRIDCCLPNARISSLTFQHNPLASYGRS